MSKLEKKAPNPVFLIFQAASVLMLRNLKVKNVMAQNSCYSKEINL
jgi:hypothetical protein